MRKFKVIALSLNGKARKKIFQSGDIVTQEQVTASVDDLVKSGFLKEVFEEDAPLVENQESEQDAVDPDLGHDFISPDPNEAPVQEEKQAEVLEPVAQVEEENELLAELKKEENAPESDEHVEVASLKEVTYEFLIGELKSLGVSFKSNISKNEAYEIWVSQKQG